MKHVARRFVGTTFSFGCIQERMILWVHRAVEKNKNQKNVCQVARRPRGEGRIGGCVPAPTLTNKHSPSRPPAPYHVDPASVLGQPHVSQRRPRLLAHDLPRHQVAVVLEHGDDDFVSRFQVGNPPRVRHEVDGFAGVAGEDDLAVGRRVDERGNLSPRARWRWRWRWFAIGMMTVVVCVEMEEKGGGGRGWSVRFQSAA